MGAAIGRLARREDGVSLVLAVVAMAAIGAAIATVITFTAAAQRSSSRSDATEAAFHLAESGIDLAGARLHGQNADGTPVNALDANALPSQSSPETDAYGAGTVTWYGTLDPIKLSWTIDSTGTLPNPASPGGTISRHVTAQVGIVYDFSQPLNAQAWNFLYSTHTGSPCDQSLSQTVELRAPLYVEGNLCLSQSSAVMPGSGAAAPAVNLVVKGSVSTGQSSHVGTTSSRINSAAIVGGCNGHVPCRWNGGGDPVYAGSVTTTAPTGITVPLPEWDYYYANAMPGPMHPCTTQTGTPPVFENETGSPVRNDSVPGVFDLTPASTDYSCVVGNPSSPLGEIAWDHTAKTLTVYGAIFIDGSVQVSSSLAQYNGQATLYVSGSMTIAQSAKLCGGIAGGTCDFASWDPNKELLIVIAGAPGTGVTLSQSAYYQGGLEATNAISVSQSAIFEGPMIGGTLYFGQSVEGRTFPLINTVPIGTPGNPNVYADPQSPGNYTG